MRATLSVFAALGLLVLSASAEAADLKLWRLDCGTIHVNDLSVFSDTFDYAGEKRDLADSCYLIRHGAELMLWDTGLPKALLGAPAGDGALSPTLAKTLTDQFAALKLDPAQVSILGISHYHFDHTGQAADFPRAKLLIGSGDLEALKAVPPPFAAEPGHLKPWLEGGAPVEAVSGDKDVFGDGSVVMLSAPGHTPGSHALLVRLPRTGPVLLSGDTVHFEEQVARRGVPTFNTDRAATLASMDRLAALAKNLNARLVIQHDGNDIAKLPALPAAAE